MLRIAVIGTGSIGRRHIGNLLALGCEVVAMDVSPQALERCRSEFPHVRVSDVLLFPGIDALVIATPAEHHLLWVEESIQRRRPFFVEKPLGTLDQLSRWREIAAMDLPVNQVGYMLRFHPDAQRLKLFRPTNGVMALRWNADRYGYQIAESSHEIDLALWLGATSLECNVGNWDRPTPVGASHPGTWRVYINDRSDRYGRVWFVERMEGFTVQHRQAQFNSPDDLGVEMYRAEMAHFLECVREGKPTICPLSDGLKVLEVCQRVESLSKVSA